MEQVFKAKATLKNDRGKSHFRGHEWEKGNGNNSNNKERSQPSPRGCERVRGKRQGYYPNSNERQHDKSKVECYNYHKFGHYA